MLFDETVQMNVDEILSRRSSPMTEKSRFDLFRLEWFTQERILKEVYLAYAQIIRCTPVAVHLIKHVRRKRPLGHQRLRLEFAIRRNRSRQSHIEDKRRRVPYVIGP